MPSIAPIFVRIYWIATLALLAGAILMAAYYAPVEATMGLPQKIFYLHLPAALNTFFAAFVAFIAAIGYLWTRRAVWDDLADAAARVTVLFCSVVLLTGMIWARSAWGYWWTWSPRLTFSLLLWLLYVVYLVLRPSIESPERRALVSSVYAIVAFLDVPLVYLSVRLLPDIHPTSVELAPSMEHTLLVWMAPVTMLCAGLIAARFALTQRTTRREDAGGALAPSALHPAGGRR
jgi:heme exporter protein C